jgi:hypothetical protein
VLKDIVAANYADVPRRCSGRFHEDLVPDRDSDLVWRYGAAGLTAIGKTNTPEYGLLRVTEPEPFGQSSNPWDLDRTTGGSSGGSAAAAAAHIVRVIVAVVGLILVLGKWACWVGKHLATPISPDVTTGRFYYWMPIPATLSGISSCVISSDSTTIAPYGPKTVVTRSARVPCRCRASCYADAAEDVWRLTVWTTVPPPSKSADRFTNSSLVHAANPSAQVNTVDLGETAASVQRALRRASLGFDDMGVDGRRRVQMDAPTELVSRG